MHFLDGKPWTELNLKIYFEREIKERKKYTETSRQRNKWKSTLFCTIRSSMQKKRSRSSIYILSKRSGKKCKLSFYSILLTQLPFLVLFYYIDRIHLTCINENCFQEYKLYFQHLHIIAIKKNDALLQYLLLSKLYSKKYFYYQTWLHLLFTIIIYLS